MKVLALAIALSAVVAAQPSADLDRFLHAHQWFELRAAVTGRSPALMRGAVAVAFNDPKTAEPLLRGVIRAAPASKDADEAYSLLSEMYRRSGQFATWQTMQQTWIAAMPDSARAREAAADGKEIDGLPDQRSDSPRRALLKHDPGDLTIPVSIGGNLDDYVFDTGADISLVTLRRAKRLGLTIDDKPRQIGGSSGQLAPFHTAIAPEIVIGGVRFRNVSFAVLDGLPSAMVDAGIMGMPVIRALGRIRWSPGGEVEIGVPATAARADANLVFDRSSLLLKMRVFSRDVLAAFDTGATTTDLNSNFADTFPDAVKDAKKGSRDITGVGGTKTFDSLELAELMFEIGPAKAWLRPATVTIQRMGAIGGECCIGNAGLDLVQAGFTIDLGAMTLRLDD